MESTPLANNGKPLISIIIATSNAGLLLPSTLDSIRNQYFESFEIIVIDNASSDGTKNIVLKNSDLVKKFITEPDKGIYDAWNKGISLAEGEWITFIGAGDKVYKDAFNHYFKKIANSRHKQSCNFICSKVQLTSVSGERLEILGSAYQKNLFQRYMNIAHVGSLHHHSLFEIYGEFSTLYRSSSDYDFLLRCRRDIKALFLDEITMSMLAGGVSYSYKALYETYQIHKRHHSLRLATTLYISALVKLFIRKNILGKRE
jgi:glycosyltransferase involved in cell wall biosynthesis